MPDNRKVGAATVAAIEQLGNLDEPLVTLDAALRPRPCLAGSSSNPDPVTRVFRLLPSVLSRDGTPLRAEGVACSFTRLRGGERLQVPEYVATVSEVSTPAADTVVVRQRSSNALLPEDPSFVPVVPGGSTTSPGSPSASAARSSSCAAR